jgi:hypothetical protein
VMSSRRLSVLATVLVVALSGACAADEAPVAQPEVDRVAGAEGAAADGALVGSLEVEPSAAAVRFVLRVENRGAGPVEVTFPSGQDYDFVVLQDGREVWRWSEDRMFTQALREERLAAGEAWTFEEVWRPSPGMAGEFEVVGRLASSDRAVEQAEGFRLP